MNSANFLVSIMMLMLVASACFAQDGTGPKYDLVSKYRNAEDTRTIRRHIEDIFNAYIESDSATARETHTHDWFGFRAGSARVIRGIDGYMGGFVENPPNPAVGFEFVELDIDVEGDYAVVLYLARYFQQNPKKQTFARLIRSIDVYRRDAAGWNQCASNLSIVPDHQRDARGLHSIPALRRPLNSAPHALSENAATPQPKTEGVDRYIRQMLAAAENGDDEAIAKLTTADWKGIGAASLVPQSKDKMDASVGAVLYGGRRIKNLTLLDQHVQVEGDLALAFYSAHCTIIDPITKKGSSGLIRFGDVLREEAGAWKQRATHIALFVDADNNE